MVRLVVLEGQTARPSFDIEAPRTLIGRSPDCDVLVFDIQVSRHHAQLVRNGTSLIVESLQPANPVIVNDHLVMGREAVVDGDLIVVGGVLFEVDIPPPLTVDPPTPGRMAPLVVEPIPPRQPRQPIVPAPRPLEVMREVAARLAEAGQRIQTRAATRPSTSLVNTADVAMVDALLADHERLGGDAELGRLAGLLSERLTNQTDIRGLYRLGAEARALIAWSQIAQRSMEAAGHLADVLGAR